MRISTITCMRRMKKMGDNGSTKRVMEEVRRLPIRK